jgi:hypothetical protein
MVSARLEPKEASRVCGQAAATLSQAMGDTTDPNEMKVLALQAMAQVLSALSTHLEPNDAAQLCRQPAASLAQTLSKARPGGPSPRGDTTQDLLHLALALSAVSAHLEAKEAAQLCRQPAASLVQAMSNTTSPYTMQFLARSLSAVAARLEPREAAQLCGQAAAILTQNVSKVTNPYFLNYLAWGLDSLAAHLESQEAARLCGQLTAPLTQAMIDAQANAFVFAQSLWEMSARLEPKEAMAALTQAMSKATLPAVLGILAQGVLAVSARLEPKEAAAALTEIMGKSTDPGTLQILAPGLSTVLARELPPQTLVDLLKHPLCVGEPRRLVLGQLARHYHRPFADQWDFVDHVGQQKLGLDLTTPPARSRELP